MKKLLPVLATLLLVGCGIPSVHPLYEYDDLITNDDLTGVWKKSNSSTTWHVIQISELENWVATHDSTSENRLRLTRQLDLDESKFSGEITASGQVVNEIGIDLSENPSAKNLYLLQKQGGENELFLAGLLQINGSYYFDLYQLYFDTEQFRFPVHIFMKASIRQDELELHYFDASWLQELIANRQVRIKHEVNRDGNVLLTASTLDLQRFVEKYGDIDEAYRDNDVMQRISTTPAFIFE